MERNKSGSLDTNVLLRLIINDLPEQTKQISKLFEEAKVLLVADIVIFEVVFTLEKFYQFNREDIIESLYTVIRNQKINCNQMLFERAAIIYLKNHKLSFVDCTLPQYAFLNNAEPLYTFDQELAKSHDNVILLSDNHG